jgi:glycogen debranching enzyme
VVIDDDGAIDPGAITGVYAADRRLLSRLRIGVAGHHLDLLDETAHGPSERVLHHVVRGADGTQRALLSDRRTVDRALTIELTAHALGEQVDLALTAEVATDLADLLQLRYGAPPPDALSYRRDGERLVAGDEALGVMISAPGGVVDDGGWQVTWTVTAHPAEPTTVVLLVLPLPDVPRPAPPASTLAVAGDHRWRRAAASAAADLDALRMRDPERDMHWIAAGAPWYMALFGRDALLTAYEALIAGSDLALDVLEALVRFQGDHHDPATGEAPGKILHELRTGHSGVFGLAPWQPYYGSVDATPLFVVLLAEAWRWGADPARVQALLPAARRAVEWCRATAADDPDGLLTYRPDAGVTTGQHTLDAPPVGLANQSWKDSADAMVHADGRVAAPPIAAVEAQGYHWRALRDLAALEDHLGETAAAETLRAEADEVHSRVLTVFSSDTSCVLAMARDGDGRPLEVASSNAGHALWVGLLDGDLARALADRLSRTDMDAGWGVRTLSRDAVAYDALSYHRGSVWPHDTALVVDGIARAGGTTAAARLTDGVLAAAEHVDWRLPELFAGYGRDEVTTPVPYPTTCDPQAWSAAAPLSLLRTMLRLDPDVPAGTVTLGPALRDDVTLRLAGIRLGDHRLDVTLVDGRITVRADPALAVVVRS